MERERFRERSCLEGRNFEFQNSNFNSRNNGIFKQESKDQNKIKNGESWYKVVRDERNDKRKIIQDNTQVKQGRETYVTRFTAKPYSYADAVKNNLKSNLIRKIERARC